MDTPDTKFEMIDRIAAQLGAGEWARRKWRARGVPHKWRLPIIQASGGMVTAGDFEARHEEPAQ